MAFWRKSALTAACKTNCWTVFILQQLQRAGIRPPQVFEARRGWQTANSGLRHKNLPQDGVGLHEALRPALLQEGDANPHGGCHFAFCWWALLECRKGTLTGLQVGLDAAGKTTILYKLKLGEIVTTIPTIGELFLPCPGPLHNCMLSLFQAHLLWLINCCRTVLNREGMQASTWRQWSTRTLASPCGMWAVRTRCVHGLSELPFAFVFHCNPAWLWLTCDALCRSVLCGGITSKTLRVSSSWSTATIATGLVRHAMSCTGCSTRYDSRPP